MARMLGRLGWSGPCSCCCQKTPNRALKRREEHQWRRDEQQDRDTPEGASRSCSRW